MKRICEGKGRRMEGGGAGIEGGEGEEGHRRGEVWG